MRISNLGPRFVTVATLLSIFFVPAPPINSAVPAWKAIVTTSNDFTADDHPVGKEVPVPSIVVRKIEGVVNEAYSHVQPDEKRYYPRSYFYGPIFKISAPDDRDLYVFHRNGPFETDFFFFILFDPKTNQITKNPPSIYAKWMILGDMGPELEKPLIAFEDIDGDGQKECIVQERVHNGTVYNAIVYHYYHIMPNLGLRPILAVETRLFVVLDSNQDAMITRSVQKLSKGEIRLNVSLDCPKPVPQHRELGFVLLNSKQPGTPFKIHQRTVVDPNYQSILITLCEEDEAKVIVEGCREYY